MIVTIDGPAGSGKSTAARAVAGQLGFRFLDTGAMYRAVGWACLERGVDLDDADAVAEVAGEITIEFSGDQVICGGKDVTEAIRMPAVTEAASVVAVNRDVRRFMVALQRREARGRNLVTEGRDQGTVVFPDAECKFFLTADPAVRARRRLEELAQQAGDVAFEDVLEQIRERDRRDANREVSPLREPTDAVRINTSSMGQDAVVAQMVGTIRKKLAASQ